LMDVSFMMMFIPHHEQKPDSVQYHFIVETRHRFSIISLWKRLTLPAYFRQC
jgi:hypothetical protein